MEYGFENTLNVFKILMLRTIISIGTYQLKPNIISFYRMRCTCYIYVKKEQEKKPPQSQLAND